MEPKEYHDCQIFGEGPEAAESGRLWTECKNHPGHENFIPISEFSLEHFPEECRSPHVLEMVKIVARSTVKLFVRHASREREPGYCFSQSSQGKGHVGSGWIVDAKKGYGSCYTKDCPGHSSSCEQWYQVFVLTAKHVVYDWEEAMATRVDIFFDDEASRKDGRMKSIHGTTTYEAETYQDYCVVHCTTHDEDLARQLIENAEQLRNILMKELRDDHLGSKQEVAGDQNFCVIVSHPHGQPKMVTTGVRQKDNPLFWETKRVVLTELKRRFGLNAPLMYTTKTCPGSSGAPVFTPFSVETRRKHIHLDTVVKAVVIRAHSIGGVLKGVGLSAGIGALVIPPPLGLMPPVEMLG